MAISLISNSLVITILELHHLKTKPYINPCLMKSIPRRSVIHISHTWGPEQSKNRDATIKRRPLRWFSLGQIRRTHLEHPKHAPKVRISTWSNMNQQHSTSNVRYWPIDSLIYALFTRMGFYISILRVAHHLFGGKIVFWGTRDD